MLRSRRGASFVLLAFEAVTVSAAFVLAALLRTHQAEVAILAAIPETPLAAPIWPARDYALLLVLTVLIWPACNRLAGAHEVRSRRRALVLASRYLAGTLLCALLTGFFAFALKLETVSRLFAFYDFSAGFVLLVAGRLSIDASARRLRRRGYGVRRIVVFGDGEAAAAVACALAADADGAYEVTGTVSSADGVRPRDLVRDPLRETLVRADEALFASAGRGMTEAEQTAAAVFLLRGRRVHIVPHLLEDTADVRRAALADLAVLSLGGPLDVRLRAFMRRAFDLAGAVALGVVSLPVSLTLAALVRLDSPGPVLFAQQRLGRDGQPFRLYKLRTMVANAERMLEEDAELHTRYVNGNYKLPEAEDPRITRAGRFLRRSGLDELPQLWNVLCGEMSLVGPRPVVPPELERYADLAPLLLAVKPGLTGHWQVSRLPAGYPLRARLDVNYVLGRSLRGDMAILLRTVPTLLRRQRRD